MRRPWIFAALFCALLALAGCASLSPAFDPPKVSLESLRDISAPGAAPRFEILLRIANPNKQPLEIAGIAYGVEVLDHELLSGVTHEVPTIAGYSEETVTLEAGLQLFELLRLLGSLGVAATSELTYRFTAKIDFEGFAPTQRIEESGSFHLR